MKTAILYAFCVSASILIGGCAEKKTQAPTDPHPDLRAGQNLSAEDAAALEATLADDPDDLSSRTKLLGYYFLKRLTSDDAKARQRKHVLWIIENHPDSKIAGLPFCGIDAVLDKEGYNKAKDLWLEQTRKYPNNATVLGNAAQFLFLHDGNVAEELLKQAQKVEPNNPKWSEKLGHIYSGKDGNAAKSLAEFEKAHEIDESETTRFYRLADLAKVSLKAGEIEKASEYARELLETAQKYPRDWNYGNAVHHGNNVLGLIALKNGDAKKAGEFLLKAGETPGSPQLGSFGPNMSLAKELLEKGEKDVVLQYFELCRKFWGMGADKLDAWVKEVNEGKIPRFGASLRY